MTLYKFDRADFLGFSTLQTRLRAISAVIARRRVKYKGLQCLCCRVTYMMTKPRPGPVAGPVRILNRDNKYPL